MKRGKEITSVADAIFELIDCGDLVQLKDDPERQGTVTAKADFDKSVQVSWSDRLYQSWVTVDKLKIISDWAKRAE